MFYFCENNCCVGRKAIFNKTKCLPANREKVAEKITNVLEKKCSGVATFVTWAQSHDKQTAQRGLMQCALSISLNAFCPAKFQPALFHRWFSVCSPIMQCFGTIDGNPWTHIRFDWIEFGVVFFSIFGKLSTGQPTDRCVVDLRIAVFVECIHWRREAKVVWFPHDGSERVWVWCRVRIP